MARYAYWLTPEGKPYKGDNKDDKKSDGKFARHHLLKHIAENTDAKGSDGLSWSYPQIDLDLDKTVLASSIHLVDHEGRPLSDRDREGLVWQSLVQLLRQKHDARAKGAEVTLTAKEFLDRVNKLTGEFLRQDLHEYVYVVGVSLHSALDFSAQINGCQIKKVSDIAHYSGIGEIFGELKNERLAKYARDDTYTLYEVAVRAVNLSAAAHHAETAIDVFCGLLNLITGIGGKRFKPSGVLCDPLGRIHLRALRTLHNPDGTPATTSAWCDPQLPNICEVVNFKPYEIPIITKNLATVLEGLGKLRYRETLQSLIARYSSAMQYESLDVAALVLWSILEAVTDTIGAKYEDTVERTLWHYGDEERALQREYLEFLRLRRNRYVHGAQSAGNRVHATYALKDCVDTHLMALLLNPLRVESLEEYGRFLSLPTNYLTLQKRWSNLLTAMQARHRIDPDSPVLMECGIDGSGI